MAIAKGGKTTKKKAARTKKEPEKKIDRRAITEAVGNLHEAVGLLSRTLAHIKAAADAVNVELELGLETVAMTAFESEHLTKPQAPLKQRDVPDPANGSSYTTDELASPGVFTRRVLSVILENLGVSSKGKMPPALRTAIMEAQGGRQKMGDCDFTGDENVPVKIYGVDGGTYLCGPRVEDLLSGKGADAKFDIIRKLIDGEIEV